MEKYFFNSMFEAYVPELPGERREPLPTTTTSTTTSSSKTETAPKEVVD